MKNIILFGPPGAGKGTQSSKLVNLFGYELISTGELIRQEIRNNTEVGMAAKTLIEKGMLVPDDVVIEMIRKLLRAHDFDKGLIFDGFPRTVGQANELNIIMSEFGTAIHHLISIDVPETELISRILNRAKDSGRSDDNLEVVRNRLLVYKEQTSPVMDYYTDQGCYSRINGVGTVDEIFNQIVNIIKA